MNESLKQTADDKRRVNVRPEFDVSMGIKGYFED